MKTKKDKKTTGSKKAQQPTQAVTPPLAIELTDKDLEQVTGGIQLNRVNETVTNLSRSQSDAEKSVTQNLSV